MSKSVPIGNDLSRRRDRYCIRAARNWPDSRRARSAMQSCRRRLTDGSAGPIHHRVSGWLCPADFWPPVSLICGSPDQYRPSSTSGVLIRCAAWLPSATFSLVRCAARIPSCVKGRRTPAAPVWREPCGDGLATDGLLGGPEDVLLPPAQKNPRSS